MIELYPELRKRQQKEFDNFPLGAAFTDDSFNQMMEEWGLDPVTDTDKIISLGAGCFIRKADKAAYMEMAERFYNEKKAGFENDDFLYSAFRFELSNYECFYSGDYIPALRALGFKESEIESDERLKRIFYKALYEGQEAFWKLNS